MPQAGLCKLNDWTFGIVHLFGRFSRRLAGFLLPDSKPLYGGLVTERLLCSSEQGLRLVQLIPENGRQQYE